jgi:hypothetical protein
MKIWLLFLFTLLSICSQAQSKFTVHAYNSKGQEYLSAKTPKSLIDSVLIVRIRIDGEVTSESMFIVDKLKFTIIYGKRPICSLDITTKNGKFSIKQCYPYFHHGAIIEVMEVRRITTSGEYKLFPFHYPAANRINTIHFEGND